MEHVLEITAAALGGDGVGRIEGQVAFVPYGLPGDRLRVRIRHQARQVLWAEIVEVLEPSPHRIAPACPQFGRCGVCTWVHFAYPAQADWKRRLVQEAFQRIGKLETEVGWHEEPELRVGYRTRAEFHGDGQAFGFYARNSRDIVDTGWCPLCHPRLNEALAGLRELKPRGNVTVTVNPEGEETLVWAEKIFPALRAAFAQAQSPWDRQPPASFLFDGAPVLNGGFSQSSLPLNRLLVRLVQGWAPDSGTLLDLYCGGGNLSLGLSPRLAVTGIDQDKAAVAAARGLSGADYRRGRETDMVAALGSQHWDCILLDPPRTGAKDIAPALAAADADRIVYVSCDPATLARDLKTVVAGGWHLKETAALDLFPNTAHVETVCVLERA
jgi:23S rRNA (uracil1939-C5)-methyltransferase